MKKLSRDKVRSLLDTLYEPIDFDKLYPLTLIKVNGKPLKQDLGSFRKIFEEQKDFTIFPKGTTIEIIDLD